LNLFSFDKIDLTNLDQNSLSYTIFLLDIYHSGQHNANGVLLTTIVIIVLPLISPHVRNLCAQKTHHHHTANTPAAILKIN
jgi:hypothetical protein